MGKNINNGLYSFLPQLPKRWQNLSPYSSTYALPHVLHIVFGVFRLSILVMCSNNVNGLYAFSVQMWIKIVKRPYIMGVRVYHVFDLTQ